MSVCTASMASPHARAIPARPPSSDVNKTTRFKTKAKTKTEEHKTETKTKTTSVKTQDQDQDHRTNNNVGLLAPDSQRNYFLQHNIL